MKNNPTYYIYKVLAVSALVVTMLSACTDVDTCGEAYHPHRASVKFDFDWSAVNTDVKPDSMYVLANRVINNKKFGLEVSTATCAGKFFYNDPGFTDNPSGDNSGDTPSTDTGNAGGNGDNPSADNEGEGGDNGEGGTNVDVLAPGTSGDETTGDNTDDTTDTPNTTPSDNDGGTKEFKLPIGEYKFLSFNLSSQELVDTEIMDFLKDESSDSLFQNVSIEYKTYKKNDEKFMSSIHLINWQDYNTYADYMISDMRPIFFDTTVVTPLRENTVTMFKFKPRPITQTVTVNMQIIKDMSETPFKIDSVWAEIAGVPHKINLSHGYIDIEETFKMMFKYSLVDGSGNPREDTYSNTANVRCQAKINVPTIVSSPSPSVVSGPGVLQVLVFAQTAGGERKKIQGKINLYNSLKAANLYKYTSDNKHVVRNGVKGTVNINAELKVRGGDILENPDNNGGIDRWLPCDDISVDI